jgi:acyl-coenzyme A synthetase/AMP-(fatty) acid ligase
VVETFNLLEFLVAPNSAPRTIAWRQGRPVSFREFLSLVCAWRSALRRDRRRTFALYVEDSAEFAGALFGAWQAGKTIYLPGDNLPGTCARLSAAVDGFLGEFSAGCSPMVAEPHEIDIKTDHFQRLESDFVGLVLYTSGTTGAPEAIPKKLAQLAREVATLESQFGEWLGSREIVATVSHQHIYGLLFRVLWPLVSGRALHAQCYPYFEDLTAVLSTRDCVLVSSPAHLQRLPKNSDWTEARKRVRAVFSSGGPLSFEAAQETNRLLGSTPIEVYGSSETGGIAWRQQRARGDEAWSPFPRVSWRIAPEQGALEVRSPNLLNEDWFTMADRAEAVEPDRFLLRGRIDRIAKIEGKRISLSAIEATLKTSPLVADARAVVADGARQRIAVFIVPTEDGQGHLTAYGKLALNRVLRDDLRQWIEPVGLPRIWRYLDALPVNAQGKTTVAELTALLEAKTTQPTKPRERLLEKHADRAVFELRAPRNMLYFDGHFSGCPILPGVVQVDWVIAYGKRCFDLPPVFRAVRALKFQRVIPPELPIKLELNYEAVKSCLSFKISSQVGSHASGRVLFGAADV